MVRLSSNGASAIVRRVQCSCNTDYPLQQISPSCRLCRTKAIALAQRYQRIFRSHSTSAYNVYPRGPGGPYAPPLGGLKRRGQARSASFGMVIQFGRGLFRDATIRLLGCSVLCSPIYGRTPNRLYLGRKPGRRTPGPRLNFGRGMVGIRWGENTKSLADFS